MKNTFTVNEILSTFERTGNENGKAWFENENHCFSIWFDEESNPTHYRSEQSQSYNFKLGIISDLKEFDRVTITK